MQGVAKETPLSTLCANQKNQLSKGNYYYEKSESKNIKRRSVDSSSMGALRPTCKRNGCRSRNAFIRDAIDFYCSWLEKEQTERFLTPALESVISAKIRDSEERISRNLFKIAVDLAILSKIVLDRDGGGYDADYLDEMRQDSIREVSETNGAIRMEERFE